MNEEKLPPDKMYDILIGTGGIGSGIFFKLTGNHTLGRDESREGFLLDSKDFCKLHIIEHYVAALLGPSTGGSFQTVALGRVGRDENGSRLLEMMRRTGIDVSMVVEDREAATMFSVCFQYPDSSGGNITTANSASARVTRLDIRQSIPLFTGKAGRGIALAAPETPLSARAELLELADHYSFLTVSSFTSAELLTTECRSLLSLTNILVLNRDEAQSLTGRDFIAEGRNAFLHLLEESLLPLRPDMRICLTLGNSGSIGFENGQWEFTPPARVSAASTAGAGDATTAGIIIATAAGLPFIAGPVRDRTELTDTALCSALDFAALLASYSVTSPDTIHLDTSRQTLHEHARQLGLNLSAPLSCLLKC